MIDLNGNAGVRAVLFRGWFVSHVMKRYCSSNILVTQSSVLAQLILAVTRTYSRAVSSPPPPTCRGYSFAGKANPLELPTTVS